MLRRGHLRNALEGGREALAALMRTEQEFLYLVDVIDGVQLALLHARLAAHVMQHPEEVRDQADRLEYQEDIERPANGVHARKDHALWHRKRQLPVVDTAGLEAEVELFANGGGLENDVAAAPLRQALLQLGGIVARRHFARAQLPNIARLTRVPRVDEEIPRAGFDKIDSGVSAVRAFRQSIRHGPQHDHATEHGDGLAVAHDRHPVAHDVFVGSDNVRFAAADMRALNRHFGERHLLARVDLVSVRRDEAVVGQQKLQVVDRADVAVGSERLSNFRRGQIVGTGNERGDDLKLVAVVDHLVVDVFGQRARLFLQAFEALLFLGAADGFGQQEGPGNHDQDEHCRDKERRLPASRRVLYLVPA